MDRLILIPDKKKVLLVRRNEEYQGELIPIEDAIEELDSNAVYVEKMKPEEVMMILESWRR